MKKKSKGVKGESSFDSKSRKVRKFDNTPLPVKVYEGKVLPGATIEKAAGKGKLPYISCKVEALNSASVKGGKNRKLTHRFFLNMTPNEKGNSHIDSPDQLVAYTKAIDATFKAKGVPAVKIDDKGPKAGVKQNVVIVDPDACLKFIEGTAGTVFKFKSMNEPSNKPGDDTLWPKVGNFIEADPEDSEEEDEDDEDEGDDEEEEDDEEEGDDDEEGEDEDDEEEDDEDSEDDDESDDEDEDENEDDDEDSEDDDDEESDDEEDDEEDDEPVKKKAKKKAAPAKKKGKK